MNPKKELLWGLWVCGLRDARKRMLQSLGRCRVQGLRSPVLASGVPYVCYLKYALPQHPTLTTKTPKIIIF